MKNTTGWVLALIELIVGVVLIVFHAGTDVMTWIVEAVGVLVLVPSVWLILVNAFSRSRSWLTLCVAVMTAAFGVWVCCAPEVFGSFIVYVLAAVLIIAGLFHMITLNLWGRTVRLPMWLYIVPALMIVAGLAFLFTALHVMGGAMVLIMGILLVVAAVNTVAGAVSRHRGGVSSRRQSEP